MKHFIHYIILCALLLTSYGVKAQMLTTYGAKISEIDIIKSASRLDVEMKVDMSDMKLKSNRSLRITPIISDGNEMMQLPAIVVEGRRRHLVHQREAYFGEAPSTDIYVRRLNRKPQAIDYEANVKYESWMNSAELILREELCACHDNPTSEDYIAIAKLPQCAAKPSPQSATDSKNVASQQQGRDKATGGKTTPQVIPQMAYAMPQSSNQLAKDNAASHIYFRINQSTIDANYMDNQQTIERLKSVINSLGENITEIKLLGYASPEGPYPFNESLAAKRAEAVKQHLAKCFPALKVPITTQSMAIDWQALRELLMESYIENNQKILAIIDDPNIKPADKNLTIRQKYPVEYNFMFKSWYPKMRVADINICQKPKPRDIATVKKALQQQPVTIPLEDIYWVANTYEKGSKEWNDIIIMAVQSYPNSDMARVNAANVAISNGDYAKAAEYLQGLPQNMPQAMNTRGILAMYNGDYQRALTLFEGAQKAGVGEASYNISLVKQLMKLAD